MYKLVYVSSVCVIILQLEKLVSKEKKKVEHTLVSLGGDFPKSQHTNLPKFKLLL